MALDFDGTNDGFSYSAAVTGATFSMSVWLKPGTGSSQTFACVCTVNTANAAGFWYNHTTDKLRYYSDASNNYPNTTAFTTGVWSHITFVANGTTGQWYKDAATDGTAAALAASATYSRTGSDSSNEAFKGSIADLRIWDGLALTADEVSAVRRGFIIRPDKILAWYPMFLLSSAAADWGPTRNAGTYTPDTPVYIDHPPGISSPFPEPYQFLFVPSIVSVTSKWLNLLGVGR